VTDEISLLVTYHSQRRRSLRGTEARASSEFRTRRHAMEHASPEFLLSNVVRPLLWPKSYYMLSAGLKTQKSTTGLAYAAPQTS